MMATTGQKPAISSSPFHAPSIVAFSLQMDSPASHIVAFWVLAMSMQLHCFQLSYDGIAEMGTWCMAPGKHSAPGEMQNLLYHFS